MHPEWNHQWFRFWQWQIGTVIMVQFGFWSQNRISLKLQCQFLITFNKFLSLRWDWVWEVPGSTSADPILCSILSLGKLGLLVFVLARTKCLISVSRNKPEQPLSMQLGSPTEMNKNKINTLSWCIQNREIMFSTVEYKNKLFRWVKSNQHESYFFGNVKHWWTYVKLLLNYHYMTLFYIIKHNLTFFTGTYYYSFFIKSSFYQPFLASRNNSMNNNKDMSNRDFFWLGRLTL